MLMEFRIIWFRYRDTQTRKHNFTTLSADSRHGSAIPVSFLYEIFHHTCTCILVYIVINACVLKFTVKGANSVRPVVSRPAGRAGPGAPQLAHLSPCLRTHELTYDLRRQFSAVPFHLLATVCWVSASQMSRIATIAASEISWCPPLVGARLERNDDKLKLMCRFPTYLV